MNSKNKSNQITTHSLWILISFNMTQFILHLINNAFSQLYLFYYETELQLLAVYIIIAQIIFSIWNAINDPIAGYLCNRSTRWSHKWGRYFPWVIIGGIPMFLFYALLYAPPKGINQFGLFIWMILILCLADTFNSIYTINSLSIFPVKFKSQKDRRRSGLVNTIIGSIGMVIGAIVPPLIYDYYDVESYKTMGFIIGFIGFILVLVNLPGSMPDKDKNGKIFESINEMNEKKQDSFWKILNNSMHEKNFVLYILIIFLYQIFTTFATSSLSYLLKYVTHAESSDQTLIWGAMILGILISLPLWNIMYKKKGVVSTMIFGMLLMALSMSPLIFYTSKTILTIVFFLVGLGMGGVWITYLPFFGDIMDYLYLKSGRRNSGVYMGIRTFFLRFVIIIQTLIYLFIHNITGFVNDQSNQTPLAEFGIRIHGVIIPMLAISSAAYILWKFYEIKGKVKQGMKQKIAEMEKDNSLTCENVKEIIE